MLVTTREQDFSETWEGVIQFARSGPTKLFYAKRLAGWVEEQLSKIEVFHGHGFYVYPNYAIGKIARKAGKDLIYHPHGFFDPWILARSRLKKTLVHLLFENANFKHVRLWRALSEKERQQIHTVVGKKANTFVLPNGVYLPEQHSEEAANEARKQYPLKRSKRLLFLSRIHPKKGLDLLLQAWKQLEPSLTSEWEIAIFGPDEGGYQATIEALTRTLELEDSCTFYGSVSGEAKANAFRSSDLFVLPSRSEGFPMAVLEAASYGLPVVQTDECNFPELTRAGGSWEASPTVESLQEALKQALHADAQELRERGAAGRALVERDYQWRAIAEQLHDYCEGV